MYIFLDESGDLGFDFTKQGTSKFFVMTVLVANSISAVKAIGLATHKSLKKINHKKKKNFIKELKSTETPLSVKRYFLDKIHDDDWCLYAVVVDKRIFRKPKYLTHSSHMYNYLAACLLNEVVVSSPQSEIIISVDKCKIAQEICEFNRHIAEVVYPKLRNKDGLVITHSYSHDMKHLQAVDLFCGGFFAKYEHKDLSWYSCFQDKVCIEDKA